MSNCRDDSIIVKFSNLKTAKYVKYTTPILNMDASPIANSRITEYVQQSAVYFERLRVTVCKRTDLLLYLWTRQSLSINTLIVSQVPLITDSCITLIL